MNFIFISHNFTARGKIWTQQIDLAYNVWLHSSVGRASDRCRGGHQLSSEATNWEWGQFVELISSRESRWSPDIFQASSFQLLKLENLLRCSLFTVIYKRSTIWISYYISHHFTACGKIWTQQIDLAPNLWIRAQLVEHRIGVAEVTGSNPVDALIFFRLLPSNCLNWKIKKK